MAEKRNSKGQFSSRGSGGRRTSPGTGGTSTPKKDHVMIRHRDGTEIHVPLGGRKK